MGNPITDLISHFYNYGSLNEGQPNQVRTDQLPKEAQDAVNTLGMRRDKYGATNAPNLQNFINMLYNPKTRPYALKAFNDNGYYDNDGNPYDGGTLVEEMYKRAKNPTVAGYTPDNLPKNLQFFRAGFKAQNTTPEGLETRPTTFDRGYKDDVAHLYKMSRGLGLAKKMGYASLNPEEIAAFVLKEGRSDLGSNGSDPTNPKSNELVDKLSKVVDYPTAGLIATLQEKAEIAKRKGITLQEAWNGTGKNSFGISGKQYSQDWNNHLKAVSSPKNKALLDFINRAYRGE